MEMKKVKNGVRKGELNVFASGSGGRSIFGEQKVYPDGSAGMYTCTCSTCDNPFMGHKRDHTCQSCEDKIPKQLTMDIT